MRGGRRGVVVTKGNTPRIFRAIETSALLMNITGYDR